MALDHDAFLAAYIECALWSSTEFDGDRVGAPLDDNYGPEDLSEEALEECARDCRNFLESEAADLEEAGVSAEQAGHDFWLTRNGHGAGFWDRGLGVVGDRLSKACKPYGSVDLYVGDDGRIHL